jgi:ribosomal protein L11 methyltransferase
MKGFIKEFILYANESLPIQLIINEIRKFPFILKRPDILSIFVKNEKEENEVKTILTPYSYKEFLLKKDEIPSQSLKSFKISDITFKRRGESNNKSIIITPGISFGYDHPATILTIEALLKHKELFINKRVLDVGIGSGILSLVMLKSGAKKIIGIDICPFVVNEAIKNIRKNKIKFKRVRVFLKDISLFKKKFSIIVANVPINVHGLISKSVKALLENDGYLLLGGVMRGDIYKLTNIYNEFQIINMESFDEWITIVMKHK